jgi:hypothetical protein
MELELVPTKLLIEELIRRKTFAGMILCSPDQHLVPGQVHEHFDLFSRLDDVATAAVLEKALTSLSQG